MPPTQNTEFNNEEYKKATLMTLDSINEMVSPAELTYLSNRSFAEVEALQQEVAEVIPAGNIVGLVMSGLVRLKGRSLPIGKAKSDVSALLRGLEILPRTILPRTVFGALYLGPVAILTAYQKILKVTGKDLDSAFPEGLWQFYLEFALREDSARHTNETIGFQTALTNYNLKLSSLDQLAAWVCAVNQICFQYDDLLYNEWYERVMLNLLEETAKAANIGHRIQFQRMSQAWATQRPYKRGKDGNDDKNYALYRRRRFDKFVQDRLPSLPTDKREELQTAYAERVRKELPAYQQQLSILATLDPERYRENRTPIPLWQARIGVIFQDCYYLLPICTTDQEGRPIMFNTEQLNSTYYALQSNNKGELHDRDGSLLKEDRTGRLYNAETDQLLGYLRPANFQAIRRQIAAIGSHHERYGGQLSPAELDEQLIAINRSQQGKARKTIKSKADYKEIQALKYALIIINWDKQDSTKPLSYLRQGRKGIGDHALTIFRTDKSMVFDQSHIFFDGVWGIALSEILTNEAVSWAAYFNSLEVPQIANEVPYSLCLTHKPELEKLSEPITPEVSAESTAIDVKRLYSLCKLLPQRNPELKLTVNDFLILYRCEFSHEYRLSENIENALFELQAQNTPETDKVCHLTNEILIKFQANNPALMIPMDATVNSPRERLYPTTFRNPFTDLWDDYQKTLTALEQYNTDQNSDHWAVFTDDRKQLLAKLNYFGQLLRAYKKVAIEGEGFHSKTLKLLAHIPHSLLKLLDEIPRRIDVLNEVIKGEEVFSNVGRVARGSSLSRFISAKDDNENKGLVWGILTDNNDILHLSLRDFRPHVATLSVINRTDLAEMIVEDYLEVFTTGFNQFVTHLLEILNTRTTYVSDEVKDG